MLWQLLCHHAQANSPQSFCLISVCSGATHYAGILPCFQGHLSCKKGGIPYFRIFQGGSKLAPQESLSCRKATSVAPTIARSTAASQHSWGSFQARIGPATEAASGEAVHEGDCMMGAPTSLRTPTNPRGADPVGIGAMEKEAQNLGSSVTLWRENGDVSRRSSSWIRCGDAGPRLACGG